MYIGHCNQRQVGSLVRSYAGRYCKYNSIVTVGAIEKCCYFQFSCIKLSTSSTRWIIVDCNEFFMMYHVKLQKFRVLTDSLKFHLMLFRCLAEMVDHKVYQLFVYYETFGS